MMSWLPFVVAGWIVAAGLYGMIRSRNLVHLVACLSVLQSATYLLFVSIGYVKKSFPPIFYSRPVGTPTVDALVQALCLTDIVVGAGVSGLLLALILQIRRAKGTISIHALRRSRLR